MSKKNSDLEELQPAKSFRTWFCGFFIRIVDDSIFLVHQTAREYLLESNDFPNTSGWKHSLKPKDAHTTLARTCIEYLLIFDSSLPDYQDIVLSSRQDIAEDKELEEGNIQMSGSSLLLLGFLDREEIEKWWYRDRDRVWEPVVIDFGSQRGVALFKYAAEYWQTHYENGSQDIDLYLACKILCRSSSSIWRTWYILRLGMVEYNLLLATGFADLGDDLSFHAINGNISALSRILESVNYRTYSEDGRTFALLNSIRRGQADAVSKLLQAGVDPDSKATVGNRVRPLRLNALYIAASLMGEQAEDGAKIVQTLLDAGANPNIVDKDIYGSRETPSYVAARRGNIDALKALVSAGSDPKILDSKMRSWLYPIALAERAGNLLDKQSYSYQKTLNLVEVCRDAGVNLNNVNILGYTALHFAVRWGAIETLESLLEVGCDYTIQDSKGIIALGIASSELESLKLLVATDQDRSQGRDAIELYRKMVEMFKARQVAGRPT